MKRTVLQSRLDRVYETFDKSYLSSDPLLLVRQFNKPQDQEIAAVMMSALAFGQVGQILRAGRLAFSLMGESPFHFVQFLQPEQELRRWEQFYYRMVRSSDLLRLLYSLQHILKRYPSLGAWVKGHYRSEDDYLIETWSRCTKEIRAIDSKQWKWTKSPGRGFSHLLPDPQKQSASKRAHLLLRWMVRKDSVDLGLWNDLPAEKLMMPIDTHVGRLAYNIGLTNRTDLHKKTSVEVTEALKRLDPSDPVKYDFALCRLGILSFYKQKRDRVKCRACPIVEICRL